MLLPTDIHPEPAASGWPRALRALRHRNFQLFVGGQSVSLIGTWMTRLATSWLVYRLTKSALLLGVVGFAGQIFSFLLAPFAGVWVERLDRRHLLIATQAASAAQSLTLAFLTLTHRITIVEIIVLSLFQGLINAFDMPGRQTFMVQMVEDKEDLGNAIALNSSMVNATRLIGPAIAGAVIAWVGEGWCFLIDGMSYFAVIASLLLMSIRAVPQARLAKASMMVQMREGWTYVSNFLPIRTVLSLFAVLSLMGWSYATLLPLFAGEVLHGGAGTLGYLTGANGVGALASAVTLTLRKNVRGLTRLILWAGVCLGGGLILFGFSHTLWLSMLIMVVVGYGMMMGLAGSNTFIQTLVPEDKRGRVMSYYTMAFAGMAPFSSLMAGGLAHLIGPSYTVMITGALSLAAAGWYWTRLPALRKVLRPIYEDMGIMQRKGPEEPLPIERSTTEPAMEDRAATFQ